MSSIIIALDNIRSHHNVGAIFRSADAFGIKEVILGGITPRPPHRDIQKSALGATESVLWTHEEQLAERLHALKGQGFSLVCIEQTPESTSLQSVESIGQDTCLIVGNEVDGVRAEIIQMSDRIVEIPQVGVKKSLNVSVCAGIVMFHFSTNSDLSRNL